MGLAGGLGYHGSIKENQEFAQNAQGEIAKMRAEFDKIKNTLPSDTTFTDYVDGQIKNGGIKIGNVEVRDTDGSFGQILLAESGRQSSAFADFINSTNFFTREDGEVIRSADAGRRAQQVQDQIVRQALIDNGIDANTVANMDKTEYKGFLASVAEGFNTFTDSQLFIKNSVEYNKELHKLEEKIAIEQQRAGAKYNKQQIRKMADEEMKVIQDRIVAERDATIELLKDPNAIESYTQSLVENNPAFQTLSNFNESNILNKKFFENQRNL